MIGGQFVALKTAGRCIDDMILRDPVAMKAALGENPKREYTEQKATPYTRMAIAALFRKAMVDAQEYERKLNSARKTRKSCPTATLRSKPSAGAARGTAGEIPRAPGDDILTALRLTREFGLCATIEHCTEGHLIADLLKEQLEELNAGIIIGPLLSERAKIEMKNLTFHSAKLLHDAGVPFALMTDHPVTPIQYLPVCAALCGRDGLNEETALRSITIDAARITGLDVRIGSIEPARTRISRYLTRIRWIFARIAYARSSTAKSFIKGDKREWPIQSEELTHASTDTRDHRPERPQTQYGCTAQKRRPAGEVHARHKGKRIRARHCGNRQGNGAFGAEYLGVSIPEEGRRLREGGIRVPYCCLAHIARKRGYGRRVRPYADRIHPDILSDLQRASKAAGKVCNIHIKVDSGMNRIGLKTHEDFKALLL